jgi:hypothetical protein
MLGLEFGGKRPGAPAGEIIAVPFLFDYLSVQATPIPVAGTVAAVAVARSANLPLWAQVLAGIAGNVAAQNYSLRGAEGRAGAFANPTPGPIIGGLGGGNVGARGVPLQERGNRR